MSVSRSGVVGSLVAWNDERGYGFIKPNEGGPQVFVHISGFAPAQVRPVVTDTVVFDVSPGNDGRPRASGVRLVDRPSASASGRSRSVGRGRVQPLALVPVALLVGYLAAAVLWWQLSWWVAALYAGMSVVTFALYATDKKRAQAGQWRVPEATLHLAGVACGWPGAVLAQQFLRHKNRKRSFQTLFWALVVLNIVVLVLVVQGSLR